MSAVSKIPQDFIDELVRMKLQNYWDGRYIPSSASRLM